MAATLRELALAAGVSVATASRAFSRPEKVEAGTRERILSLAQTLDYTPNHAAQALSTGRTGSLGLVVPDLNNPFYTGIVKGAQAGARESGRALLIADTDENPEVEFSLVENLAQRSDAIILCSSRMSAAELAKARTLCPVVLINRREPRIPAVTFDSARGVREAAMHLRALGHTRVAYVAGPAHSFSDGERRASLARHFPERGLEVVHVGHFEPTSDGGRAAADRVLLAEVTAVMVYNDVMALGLISRLLAYGVAIPESLSVIGWDDIEFAEMFTPPLTTVRMPREEAGRAAVAYLDAALADRAVAPPELETHLVFRRTTSRALNPPAPDTSTPRATPDTTK